ncbi:MAG: AraC family transcriptional regulator [Oscillospiraceae bacterium]|nr:AraC family transcriptional regulator [Oscillospiraceae bacterium]
MIINNVGFNHCHDADFYIDRPNGSGDYLLLLLKTDSIFTLEGTDQRVPGNTVFLYKKGTPQFYRCIPQNTFSNDFVHFDFENDEEEAFAEYNVPFNTPIPIKNINFLSFCIKSVTYESYSCNKNKHKNVLNYMSLIFSKIDEEISLCSETAFDNKFEKLSIIRGKLYSRPYDFHNVEEAAHELRMSKSLFQHNYKKKFGTTFINDLIKSRTAYAKMLLTTTNLNIDAVASQCGYKTYVHFAKQFREQTGMTPSEYRNANKNKT